MIRNICLVLLAAGLLSGQGPTIRTNVDEVLLDLIVRDKKGKPVADLKPEDISVMDNGTRQKLTGFRLVSGAEAIGAGGTKTTLDPLRQVRLVTLAFEAMTEADQRKLARTAALDLINGGQGTNVFYSVVSVSTRLMVLQPFTADKAALAKAIEKVTGGLGGPGLASESDAILAELKRNLGGNTGAPQDSDVLAAASQTAGQTVTNGAEAIQAKLAAIMLDMLRMDTSVSSQGTRLTLSALRALVDGQRAMPGRKSILYFTTGMYLSPELDAIFRNLVSVANRSNVTFYSVDTRGVMVSAQTAAARAQLAGAARASATTMTQTSGPVTKDQVMSSDNAEVSGRANVSEAVRDLAESTGGFLIGESNDLRVPLRQVNEEIGSYYEVSYNPGIQSYDGSFRKLAVTANRKDLVIHARSGYFALAPDVRGGGVMPYEAPLLELLSKGAAADDVKFRSAGLLFGRKEDGAMAMVLVELPLHELQAQKGKDKNLQDVHCSIVALVKDAKGEVREKLSRDRSFRVTADQLKMGNFLEKLPLTLPAGNYTIEAAVMDRNSGKAGVRKSAMAVPDMPAGVGISSLVALRSYTPNAKDMDAADPLQFQGGAVTPTLDGAVKKEANAALRLFFTVYQDRQSAGKPTVEIEFLQGGKSLTKVPMELPAADAQGRIPYVMTIPAASIPAGNYEVKATARQGGRSAESVATVQIVE